MKRIVALLTVGMMLLGSLMVGAAANTVEKRDVRRIISLVGCNDDMTSADRSQDFMYRYQSSYSYIFSNSFKGYYFASLFHDVYNGSRFPALVVGDRYELSFRGYMASRAVTHMTVNVDNKSLVSNNASHSSYFDISGSYFSFNYPFVAQKYSTGNKDWFRSITYYISDTLVPPNTLTIVYGDFVLTHIYEEVIPEYALTPTASEGGKISPSEAQTVEQGESSTFSIEPEPGYFIKDVTVNGGSVGAVDTYTFANVSADGTIHAEFEVITYQMRSMSAENGSIRPTGEWTVREGEPVTFFFTPDKGYRVAEVRVNEESVGAVSRYTVDSATADLSVEADFEPLPPGVVMGADGYDGLVEALRHTVGVVVPVGMGLMAAMVSIRLLPRLIKRMLGQS